MVHACVYCKLYQSLIHYKHILKCTFYIKNLKIGQASHWLAMAAPDKNVMWGAKILLLKHTVE